MFPRDIVCLRNMSINTLHKGDDDDDDDDDDNNNNNNNNNNIRFQYQEKWLQHVQRMDTDYQNKHYNINQKDEET